MNYFFFSGFDTADDLFRFPLGLLEKSAARGFVRESQPKYIWHVIIKI